MGVAIIMRINYTNAKELKERHPTPTENTASKILRFSDCEIMGGGVGLILANYSGKLFPKSSQETNLFLGRATPDKLLKL